MWTQVSSHASRGLRAVSFRSTTMSPVTDTFDMGIFFGSYESRCLVSSRLLHPGSCRSSTIVLFTEASDTSLRVDHDRRLTEQVTRVSEEKPVVRREFSVHEVERVLEAIVEHASVNGCLREGSRWFIDIVGAPKVFFMGLIAFLREQLISPSITVIHPGAHYDRTAQSESVFPFTSGFSRYMWVPWLWGMPDPTKPWWYFFLLGFEGNRSYAIYDNFEPLRVDALIAKPGYRRDYTERAFEENRAFLEEARPVVMHADAGDPVQTWKMLEKRTVDGDPDSKYNICIAPLGPKPQALGGALFALAHGCAGALYQMPRKFHVRDVKRGRVLWRCDITL